MDVLRQNFAAFFRSCQILFLGLLGGQILTTGVIVFVLQKPDAERNRYTDGYGFGHSTGFDGGNGMLLYILPLLALALIGLGFFLFRRKVSSARAETALSEKLLAYRTALILKWAPMEGATLITVVGYFLSGTVQLLGLAGIIILVFALQRPLKNQLINDLQLDSREQTLIDDPDAIVVETTQTRN